jgi:uncharacterized protein
MSAAIDACAFHDWTSVVQLADYLSDGWREVILRPGDPTGPMVVKSKWAHRNPLGDKAAWAYPSQGMPGSDLDLLLEHMFAGEQRNRVVLGFDEGLLASAHPLHHLSKVVVQAANDWTAAQWLARDERLFGLILVATSQPAAAAAEIRRLAGNERFVGVALGHNGLGRPFGHPVYHPIYEAAAEAGLPVVIQVGSDATTDSSTIPLSGGRPQTYAEYHALASTAFSPHATSLITQGVFELYPGLRVLLLGGGIGWLPSYLTRLDQVYSEVPMDVPWLRKAPSEYFREHIRVSTYSLEDPTESARLVQLMETVTGMESILLYASGYPNWDTEEPDAIAARIPEAWHERVFSGNAEEFYRWPSQIPVGAAAATTENAQN